MRHTLQPALVISTAGKGYGLVAAQPIQKGQLLAVCPPLAWVSGAPGQPPRLEQLIRHISNSCYNNIQTDVLQSLCSLPALDEEHAQRQQQRQQQVQQDRLLRAAAEVEAASEDRPGVPVSSLPLSQSAALQRMQQQLRAEGRLGDDDDDEVQPEDEQDDRELWGATSSSSSSMRRVGRNLVRADATSVERRRVPDLLELMECTSAAAADADGSSAAVASSAAGRYSGSNKTLRFRRGSSSSNVDAAAGSLSSVRRLDMRPERCVDCCFALLCVSLAGFDHL
jgi:hypothetical protein